MATLCLHETSQEEASKANPKAVERRCCANAYSRRTEEGPGRGRHTGGLGAIRVASPTGAAGSGRIAGGEMSRPLRLKSKIAPPLDYPQTRRLCLLRQTPRSKRTSLFLTN